jgi:hypothetical protein
MAEPGGICISSSVYDQITGKLDLGFHDIGEQTLKNIARPIRVYRVSGAVPPTRPAMPPAASAPIATAKRGGIPLAIGAVVVAALGAGLAWQAGWFRSSLPTTASSAPQVKLPAPAVEKSAGTSAAGDATAARAQAESETQRLRAEVEALKKQTEAELARARADADAERKTRAKAEADAAAAHKRAQAETEAVLARRKGEAGAAADSPATRTTKASDSQALPARKAGDVPPGAQERSVAGTTASVASFDGTWIVTVDCPRAADGASGFTFDFPARVNDGLLKGEFGTEGAPGWLRLEGRIQTDGSAKLDAKGLTGDPKFNLKGVQKGVPYAYDVAARFEGSRGTGRRLQLRPCELRFVKQ